eukprot:9340079-Pyramimonas_sp.AAC.1
MAPTSKKLQLAPMHLQPHCASCKLDHVEPLLHVASGPRHHQHVARVHQLTESALVVFPRLALRAPPLA